MKILYIAQERRTVEAAAAAFRRLSQDVTLSWAQGPAGALAWIRENRDALAVIVEAGAQNTGGPAFVEHARGLGVATPVALIAAEHLDRLLAAVKTGLDVGAAHERQERELLETRLRELEAWQQDAPQHLAEKQAQHDAALVRSTRICTALQNRLLELEAALHSANQRAAAQTTATEQMIRREAELRAAAAEAVAARAALERSLAVAEAAHDHAVQCAADEAASLTTLLNDRDAQHQASLRRTNRICTALQERLLQLEDTLRLADERHAADSAVTERLASREAELSATLAESIADRNDLEYRLAEAETANARAAADLVSAAKVCATLERELAEQSTARSFLSERLAAAEAERQRVFDLHTAEVASLTAGLADLQVRHDAALAQNALADRNLRDLSMALDDARAQIAASMATSERQAARETELVESLTGVTVARTAIEQRLSETEAVHREAEQRAAAELAAAADRYAALEDRLDEEIGTRRTLEDRLSAADTARESAEARHARDVDALAARLAELHAQYDAAKEQTASVERQRSEAVVALEQAHQEWKRELAAMADETARREAQLGAAVSEALAARTVLEERLADAEALHRQADQRSAAELAAAAERHTHLEGRLAGAEAARMALEERLAAAAADRRDADQEHAGALADLRARLADLQAQHDAAATDQRREIAGLRDEASGLRRQLNAMKTHAAAFRREAERLPGLQQQLAERQKEIRRQFERAPYGLCECTPDGAVTRVNHVLAQLLGYRTSSELPLADFAVTALECAADLSWLLERAATTRTRQAVETTLKTRDRQRLFVRLHALTTDGSVLIAVEDLTKLSALEQRVREAQRLEAVGRVASEVAVTCDTLLRDVTQGGRLWLAGFENDPSLRQQGELLLGDVTRAAGLLRQFAVYGHKQITNLEPVSLLRVLREMKPVLERVLGDDIQLVLPKTTRPFEVDVESERVERILVNVANYARERMPHGGRVRIQLETTVVNRRFLASHPKVRAGAHVVMTISEVLGAVRPALPMPWPVARSAKEGAAFASEKPGMDLGPLVALISDLGGHLWMSVEPAGNVTLQIHLPKRTQDDTVEPPPRASFVIRGRQLARWFRH